MGIKNNKVKMKEVIVNYINQKYPTVVDFEKLVQSKLDNRLWHDLTENGLDKTEVKEITENVAINSAYRVISSEIHARLLKFGLDIDEIEQNVKDILRDGEGIKYNVMDINLD
jgi:hypothetical protein